VPLNIDGHLNISTTASLHIKYLVVHRQGMQSDYVPGPGVVLKVLLEESIIKLWFVVV